MYTDNLTIERALKLEQSNKIIIFDASQDSNFSYHQRARQWKDNFTQLRTKFRNTSPNKIPELIQARYRIEINQGIINKQTNTYSWRYLYGVETSNTTKILTPLREYVYLLVNPAYPNLVKIGTTTKKPEIRLKQINSTGTVNPWELYCIIPVKPGTGFKLENTLHKQFQDRRYHVKNKNDREMFFVSPEVVLNYVKQVSSLFLSGTIKYYRS